MGKEKKKKAMSGSHRMPYCIIVPIYANDVLYILLNKQTIQMTTSTTTTKKESRLSHAIELP